MVYDLQKAGIWKRIAAWMFDGILTGMLAVGFALVLSGLLGYDSYSQSVDMAYNKYEQEYGIEFNISQDEYAEMSEAERQSYDAAYQAMTADKSLLYNYNMMLNLMLIITSAGILLAILLWEFAIPLWIGNGQTLGKKIFGLCLVRTDGVKLNNIQLFTRTILGKFTVDTMLPVYILFLTFWGTMGLMGTVILFALAVAQLLSVALSRTNAALHDLLAGTAVVDIYSQMIFRSTEDLIAFKKQVAADQAARQPY